MTEAATPPRVRSAASAPRPAASRRCSTSSRALAPDLGLAYVVVVHLSPDHKSELPAILGRWTTMPVLQVGDQRAGTAAARSRLRHRAGSHARDHRFVGRRLAVRTAAGTADGDRSVLSIARGDAWRRVRRGAVGQRQRRRARRARGEGERRADPRPGSGRGDARQHAARRDCDRGRRCRPAGARARGSAGRAGQEQAADASSRAALSRTAPPRRPTRTRRSRACSTSCENEPGTTSRSTSAARCCGASPGGCSWRTSTRSTST